MLWNVSEGLALDKVGAQLHQGAFIKQGMYAKENAQTLERETTALRGWRTCGATFRREKQKS
jgi:hypothetical protein